MSSCPSRSPLLKLAEEVAMTHHERLDGTGYLGLTGEAIPLTARIVAMADVYDALTSVRPYKDAWPKDRALTEIQALSGRSLRTQHRASLPGGD